MGTEDVRIWDATTGKLTRTISNRGVLALRASVDPGGSVMLASDEGGGVRLWDLDTGEVLASFPADLDAAFVPARGGTLIAIAGTSGNAYCSAASSAAPRASCASAPVSASLVVMPSAIGRWANGADGDTLSGAVFRWEST